MCSVEQELRVIFQIALSNNFQNHLIRTFKLSKVYNFPISLNLVSSQFAGQVCLSELFRLQGLNIAFSTVGSMFSYIATRDILLETGFPSHFLSSGFVASIVSNTADAILM